MDERLAELRQITIDLAQRLEEADADDLSAFVEARDTIIRRLQADPLSESEKAAYRDVVGKILAFEPIFRAKAGSLRDEASRELSKLHNAKQQRNRYETGIGGGYVDSLFIDRKK